VRFVVLAFGDSVGGVRLGWGEGRGGMGRGRGGRTFLFGGRWFFRFWWTWFLGCWGCGGCGGCGGSSVGVGVGGRLMTDKVPSLGVGTFWLLLCNF